ncbi:SDR family NAD(P)-dependent oxidoreductase [Aurantiacibacter luteus]|uniref:3-hydroxy-2-methylbutyryl-CoA dehydrogenase n=1 Tax=Aurantiacibacter luteus TaxID=1581420 RepID=A0A0G9MSS9_9SPHN|nr:SDR family NAD(P)-dependent oxidoreductase [Aurantiacibacter luteus]KLE33776.1 3-hydroxy-2-methylbutyryl-CoA dehydrogenase [Aurantiacibacter luteus]
MQIDTTLAAVVTGGASGLGEATARALAAKGAKVAIFDMNADAGEAVAADIEGVFCKVDVSDEASVDAGFARARAAHGQERVLVNCAGIGTVGKLVKRDRETGAISHHPVDLYRKTIEINLVGTFICMAKAASGMMTLDPVGEHGERGAIVNTASVAAEDGQIGQVAYASSKAAVKGMTLPVARDLMGEGIRVNAILPGIFRTPMLAGLPEKAQAALAEAVPFPKRLGDPAEYASLVCFMVETGYFNGECVRLDGAIRMPPK